MITQKIMTEACIVKSWLYEDSSRNCSPGIASSARTPSAKRPPIAKKMKDEIV